MAFAGWQRSRGQPGGVARELSSPETPPGRWRRNAPRLDVRRWRKHKPDAVKAARPISWGGGRGNSASLPNPKEKKSLIDMVPRDWTPRLALAIAGALREFASHVGTEPLAMLALDCHPWHGSIGIAVLTAKEVAADRALDNPAEMAAWRFFDFASEFDSWHAATALGQEMKAAYYSGDRPAVVEAFFSACAAAITSDAVAVALEGFIRVDDFRLSAAHPDDRREFVSGAGRA